MLEHVSAWLEPLQSVALVALHVDGGAWMLHVMLSGFATSRTAHTRSLEACPPRIACFTCRNHAGHHLDHQPIAWHMGREGMPRHVSGWLPNCQICCSCSRA
jgi:hypothetical protein